MRGEFIRERYSKRHHYLPVFFLKGFTGSGGTFYVYDKIQDRILENQTPDSKYFEKDLNNYRFEGEIKFTLEESFFTPLDTELAPLFRKIRNNNTYKDELSEVERFQVLYFLMTLFWRLPYSDQKAVELIKKEGLSNKYYGFFKEGERIKDEDMPDIKAAFLNDVQNQRLYKMALPTLQGSMNEIIDLYDQWNLYSLHSDAAPIIIGDNPFIINNPDFGLDRTLNELIFPLASNRLLVLSDRAPAFLESHLTMQTNLCLILQSQRYVSCGDRDYLLALIDAYKQMMHMRVDHLCHEQTFHLLHKQASFSSFADYHADYRKNMMR